jgi:hypothetical protein
MPQNTKSRGGTTTKSRSSNGETDRYRRAAEDALQQLDWAIGYLHGIRKTEISKVLSQNRSYIRRNLMGDADEALPGQKTDET